MPVDEGAIIHSEVFAATNWASADFSLSGLANRPRGVPRRLHVHNSDTAAQNLVVVTPGGVRREFSIAPGAHPYPIDLIAEAISFDSGADLTVTAEWANPGGDGTGFISHPSQVEGLKVYTSNVVTGAGTAAFSVRDLSGNGNHGTQSTTANQPTPSGSELLFTSGDHYDIDTTSLGLSGASQAVFVFGIRATLATPVANRRILADQAASSLLFTQNLGAANNVTLDFPDISNRQSHANLYDLSTSGTLTVVFNGGLVTSRWDGVQVAQSTIPNTVIPALSTPSIAVGGWNFQWEGSIHKFMLLTGRIPTEAELQYLENYGV